MYVDRSEDHELAQRVREGDDDAFAALVARHRAGLLRFVAGRCSGESLAEDAVQEALVSAHRALREGRVPVDVRAWLYTIAARRAIDLHRRERDALPLDAALIASIVPGPEALALQSAEVEGVVRAWRDLPERQRRALTMSALEGRSLQDVADDLGVAPTAAKSLVARGRRTLAAQIEAADLSCATARSAIDAAASRGVRLSADVTRHVRSCRACAQAHRLTRLRRRLRAVALVPLALEQRLRELLMVASGHDGQIGMAGKVCAVACVGALGAGSAAVVVSESRQQGRRSPAAEVGALARPPAAALASRPVGRPRPRTAITESPPAVATSTQTTGAAASAAASRTSAAGAAGGSAGVVASAGTTAGDQRSASSRRVAVPPSSPSAASVAPAAPGDGASTDPQVDPAPLDTSSSGVGKAVPDPTVASAAAASAGG